jgi:ribosome maturation factor RimP
VNQKLQDVVTSEVGELGYELVELRMGGSKGRPLVDVRIDRRDGTDVTVDDCARTSRAIEARLDADGILGDKYVLEVSSPGVERPLRRPQEWRRFIGKQASVNSPALNGRQDVEIINVEGDETVSIVVLRDRKGAEHRVPLAEVKDARLAFHWKR